MKIDAKIEWNIDVPDLDLTEGKTDTVTVDSDYVRCDEHEVIDWIENELSEKYGRSFRFGEGDFTVENLRMILTEIGYEEFENKTDYSDM